MPEKAQQHPQVQADVAQARSVVAGDAARSPSPQSTPGLGVTEHALHSEQGQGGSPKQNAGSWQKGTGKADITAVPLTKEQWAARPEFKPDPNPIQAEDLMAWSPEHPVSPEMKSNIMTGAQGLLDLLPRDIAQNLGKVRLSVVSSLGKNVAGKYDPSSNSLILSADQIRNFTPEQLRKTMWHEMSHWLYHKAGSASAHESLKKWRSAIEEHWNKRTKGKSKEWNEEKTWQYINSDWISDYAGRFYGQVGGLELPSVYIEAASWGPGRLAKLANKFSRSQETFEIILSILKK